MKYRLKDRELQKKLDEATDGEFSRRLQNDRERMDGMILIGCMGMIEDRRRHNHTKLQRMTLCFATDEIEEVPEYDPHAWNKYPEVEPPKDVWMRCENVYGSEPERLERFAARYTSQYEDGEWVDAWFSNGLRRDVTSFRPWDEEDDEE